MSQVMFSVVFSSSLPENIENVFNTMQKQDENLSDVDAFLKPVKLHVKNNTVSESSFNASLGFNSNFSFSTLMDEKTITLNFEGNAALVGEDDKYFNTVNRELLGFVIYIANFYNLCFTCTSESDNGVFGLTVYDEVKGVSVFAFVDASKDFLDENDSIDSESVYDYLITQIKMPKVNKFVGFVGESGNLIKF